MDERVNREIFDEIIDVPNEEPKPVSSTEIIDIPSDTTAPVYVEQQPDFSQAIFDGISSDTVAPVSQDEGHFQNEIVDMPVQNSANDMQQAGGFIYDFNFENQIKPSVSQDSVDIIDMPQPVLQNDIMDIPSENLPKPPEVIGMENGIIDSTSMHSAVDVPLENGVGQVFASDDMLDMPGTLEPEIAQQAKPVSYIGEELPHIGVQDALSKASIPPQPIQGNVAPILKAEDVAMSPQVDIIGFEGVQNQEPQVIEKPLINPDLVINPIIHDMQQAPEILGMPAEPKKDYDKVTQKKNMVFIGILFGLIILFILFLPKIVDLFG